MDADGILWTAAAAPSAAKVGRGSVSVAITGSGGVGAMTAGQLLLHAAAACGFYGMMGRTTGPQIRGGEAAALLRLAVHPVSSLDDGFDLLVALDWANIDRFAAELPLLPGSLVIADPAQGELPEVIRASGARIAYLPLKDLARAVPEGRVNMVGLGIAGVLLGLPIETVLASLAARLGAKGEAVLAAGVAALQAGADAAESLDAPGCRLAAPAADETERHNRSGNEATALGAVAGGIGFVAAYPITPATEVLERLATELEPAGGMLVQAEDELASVTMAIGASFAGTPAMTATSGPGLSLMVESIGLAVASETPLVVVDVMRAGPSTGIPTKSEQADLDIAVHGLHGDAPHVVLAPNGVGDCQFTTHWAVGLAETLQTAAIVLSDQALGQTRAIIPTPPAPPLLPGRLTVAPGTEAYRRYALTESGISPMAIPGTPGAAYVADGLEHTERGTPSAQAADHQAQLDKRERKLAGFDFSAAWADIEGTGDMAILTWGSPTGPAREAAARARARGIAVRLVSVRLLLPAQPVRMAAALADVRRVLIVEQTHGRQFHRFLRSRYDLPAEVAVLNRPGPLPLRPAEVLDHLLALEGSR